MTGRSTLVTGAYGLLGSWLVPALLDAGAAVTVIRRDEAPSALRISGTESRVNVVAGDVTDAALVDRTLVEYGIDTVFHLAAQTLVGAAARSPVATFEVNIRGTWTVLEACRRQDVARVLVASSDKSYGSQPTLPYREDLPLLATYPYDVSKAAADMLARSYWHTYGLPVAVTRFANLYGGGDLNFSRLVPEAVIAALDGRPPVLRSDGTPERDFLYVEDAVGAYLAICEALDGDGARGEAFNAGWGRAHSVREVAELICEIAGSDVEPDIQGAGTPSGEISRQYVDSAKLEGLTGWRPRVGLREGLERTVGWYREHADAVAQ